MQQRLCVKDAEANEAIPTYRLLGFLIVAAALFVSCSYPERDDLIGTYFIETPFGEETFVLRSDGTYKQTIIVYEFNDTVSSHGEWEYNRDLGSVGLRGGLQIALGCEFNPDYATPGGAIIGRGVKWLRFPGTAMRLSAGCEGEFYVKRD